MKKKQLKDFIDYVPLVILTVSAVNLIWAVATTDFTLFWKNYVGLFVLPLNYFLFWWRHKIGVLFLGLTLLLGAIGLLSFSPINSITTFSIGRNSETLIPIFRGQPIFLLWMLIQFVLSFRQFVGILSKSYWEDISKLADEKKVDHKYLFDFDQQDNRPNR